LNLEFIIRYFLGENSFIPETERSSLSEKAISATANHRTIGD